MRMRILAWDAQCVRVHKDSTFKHFWHCEDQLGKYIKSTKWGLFENVKKEREDCTETSRMNWFIQADTLNWLTYMNQNEFTPFALLKSLQMYAMNIWIVEILASPTGIPTMHHISICSAIGEVCVPVGGRVGAHYSHSRRVGCQSFLDVSLRIWFIFSKGVQITCTPQTQPPILKHMSAMSVAVCSPVAISSWMKGCVILMFSE